MRHTVNEIKLNNGAKGLLINIPSATVVDVEAEALAGAIIEALKKARLLT